MKIIAVDDEPFALQDLAQTIRKALPSCGLNCFSTPGEALRYAEEEQVDVAFLDIEMGGMNGLALAKALKDINGRTNIVFATGYAGYAVDAFMVPASGYLLKPVSERAVSEAMELLRYPVTPAKKEGVRVQTFGNFEIYVDGCPVTFSRSRSKEILAYLVDRQGAGICKRELAGILWEEGEYSRTRQIQLQTLISEMLKSLREAGAGQIVVRRYNSLSVDTTKFSCDYYEFMDWEPKAVNAYLGEYMANYSWAEFTTGTLNKEKRDRI